MTDEQSNSGARGTTIGESALLDALGEAACLCDAQGNVVWSNDLFQQHDAVIREKVAGFCRDAAIQFLQLLGDHDGGNPRQRRHYGFSLEPADRHFKVRIAPIASERGGLQVAAVVMDVTRQRRTRRKISAISRAGRELLRIEADLVKEMNAVDRLSLLEDKVIRFSHELLKFDHFAVRLLNLRTNKLELVMSAGLPPEAIAIELHAERENNGISGYVAATGESYICRDVTRDHRYIFGMAHAGSSLTVPLKLFDRVIGVFNVESDRINAFGETDKQFAEIFANSLAMALHILNLLVVERCATSETAAGAMQGELAEPLNDIACEAEWLKEQAALNPQAGEHINRIVRDVESIRRRVKNLAKGPTQLLGVEEALRDSRSDPALKGGRILLADNDEPIIQTVRDVLAARGCEVIAVDTGQAAIDRLEHAAEHGERFHLVLSDINLGDRTGYDVFSAAKKVDPELPVILMTGFGYDPHHSIVRASQEGLQCVLFKPFQAEKLVEEARIAVVKMKMAKAGVN